MDPHIILTLQKLPSVGSKSIRDIFSLDDFKKPTSPEDMIKLISKANSLNKNIKIPTKDDVLNSWNEANEVVNNSIKNNIELIPKSSPYYPQLLLKIENSPELLHVQGNVSLLNKSCIAVVGTRKPTNKGICVAKKMSEFFSKKNYVIVSGLANGIDTAAHETALNTKGMTIAILAHPLNKISPKKNLHLAKKILDEGGALISEYPLGGKNNRGSFVQRNRIQTGLSLGTAVIETKIKGGTMHTADFCKKQGRQLIVFNPDKEVFTDNSFSGNYKLINEKKADIVLDNKFEMNGIESTLKKFKDSLLSTYINNKKKHSFQKIESNNSLLSLQNAPNIKDCYNCELYHKCHLVEQGWGELCPKKNKKL